MKCVLACTVTLLIVFGIDSNAKPLFCVMDNAIFLLGTNYNPDNCTSCTCHLNGQITCDVTECPWTFCLNPVKVDGQCCPSCRSGYSTEFWTSLLASLYW
nr:cysteine-rich motor neuron 1 protein-like [Biomphalaria glabrata]